MNAWMPSELILYCDINIIWGTSRGCIQSFKFPMNKMRVRLGGWVRLKNRNKGAAGSYWMSSTSKHQNVLVQAPKQLSSGPIVLIFVSIQESDTHMGKALHWWRHAIWVQYFESVHLQNLLRWSRLPQIWAKSLKIWPICKDLFGFVKSMHDMNTVTCKCQFMMAPYHCSRIWIGKDL